MHMWLTLDGSIEYALIIVVPLLKIIGVKLDIVCIVKNWELLRLLSLLVSFAMTIWGCTIVVGCTEQCTLDKSAVQPYKLMRVIVILQLVATSLLLIYVVAAELMSARRPT